MCVILEPLLLKADMPTFAEWWEKYPRKVCKKDAEKVWKRLTTEQQFAAFEALPVHVRYWEAAGRSREYLPHGSTWLSGERWTDELEMPEAPENAQWWRTRSGIEARAREKGIFPKAGEDHESLKARILAMERG